MSSELTNASAADESAPRQCPECRVTIEGAWPKCPLCGASTTGGATPTPLPVVPLTFSRQRVVKTLLFTSLGVILASFAAQLLWSNELDSLGAGRSVWLGISAMWLVVLTAIRKRRNLAKGTVYLVLLAGLICTYWDYLTGWHGWALTYAVPIVCASAAIGLLITVRLLRIEVGEYIVYSGLTVLFGLLPIVFVVFGWVTTPLPSLICVALSAAVMVLLQVLRGRAIRHELGKRFHL